MIIKLLFLSSLIVSLLTLYGCGYKIERTNYEKKDTVIDCDVIIYRNAIFRENKDFQYIGSINLEEAGFSSNCSEEDAIAILKKEACSINANVINITDILLPGYSSSCYRCTAVFYKVEKPNLLTNSYLYKPGQDKRKPLAPFDFMPFNYLNMYFAIDYVSNNPDYWKDILGKYHKPTEKTLTANNVLGFGLIMGHHYFDLHLGANNTDVNRLDSLKSQVSSWNASLSYGYNILNKGVTISPFVSLRYNYQNHTVSYINEDISVEQWINHPDMSLRSHQLSTGLGVNVNIPVYQIMMINCGFGYNFNLHKYPFLYSGNISVQNMEITQIRNFFLTIGIGFGAPVDRTYTGD